MYWNQVFQPQRLNLFLNPAHASEALLQGLAYSGLLLILNHISVDYILEL